MSALPGLPAHARPAGTLWFAYNAPVRNVDYAAVIRELIALGARADVYPQMKAHVEAVLTGAV